jgi:hypothetical protein
MLAARGARLQQRLEGQQQDLGLREFQKKEFACKRESAARSARLGLRQRIASRSTTPKRCGALQQPRTVAQAVQQREHIRNRGHEALRHRRRVVAAAAARLAHAARGAMARAARRGGEPARHSCACAEGSCGSGSRAQRALRVSEEQSGERQRT